MSQFYYVAPPKGEARKVVGIITNLSPCHTYQRHHWP